MIGHYNYTVILTYIGTVFGFVGITYIGNGNLKMALICLMIAGFCDMFDGKIASIRKRTTEEKRFGIQIDSLSDLICFGVLPALIALYFSDNTIIHTVIAGVFLLCALIRLAWFNVDEEMRQNQDDGSRKAYMGLPVTTTAILLPLVVGVGKFFNLPVHFAFPWIMLVIGIAFLLPFPLKKPQLVGKLLMLAVGIASFAFVMIGV